MKQFNYRVLIPLFLVIACGYCFAQNSPDAVFKSKIVPPSPEAASLGKYGQYPVTLNNGLVNISLPIYDITAGQLHLPISLSYHAAGVRAYDVSSCVGLGWTLNAGGAITRSILGFPDESTIGMLNNPFPDPTDAGETFQCFIGNVANSAGQIMGLDSQADLFSYSLNGSGGKFVFKSMPSTGMPWQILTTPATPVKITGDFTQFTIVDLDGTTYIFGQPERSVVQTDMGSLSDGPTAWYVTSIISTNKADTINFSYTTVSQIVSVQANNSLSVREDSYSSLVSTVALSQSSTVTTHYSVNIQQITYRGGKVLFEYATDRVDVPNGKRLTDIRIFNNVGGQYSEMKRFNFSQSYFIATSATEISQTDFLHVITPGARNNRLRLDSFYEQGYDGATISNPPYQFSYDPGQGFAVYGSTAQDFMGYYNGAIGNLNLLYYGLGNTNFGPTFSTQFGANRLVNPAYMKAGSLTKITYPTGGYTSFEMEPNQINYTKTTSVPNSVYYNYQLTSMVPSVYQGYQVSFTLTPAMTNNNDSIQTQFDVNVINDKQGQPTISTSIGVFDVTSQTYATVVNQYGIPVGTAVVGITSLTTEIIQSYYVILLKGHTYTLSYGSGFPNTTNEIHTMVSWYAPTGSYSTINTNETDYTGGLRIKSITNFDGINPVTKKGYVYTKWYYNSNLFNGDIPMLLDKFKSSCIRMWSPGSGVAYQRITYDAYGENVTFQIASSASLTASYEEVEEYDLDQSGNSLGKTVYTFNKRVDYISRLWPAFRSDEEWKRGQVSDVRVYRSSPISGQYILVKETSNIYNDSLSYSSKNFVSRLSNSVDVPGTSGLYDMVPYKECSGVNSYNVYDWAELDQEVYVSNLASTTTTTYDENGLTPQTTVAQYFYDNAKHGQLTRTLKDGSDSKTQFSITKYPLDYQYGCDAGPCITNLTTQFLLYIAQCKACKATYYPLYQSYNASGSTTVANNYFNQYLGCMSTLQTQINQLVQTYNSCITTYNSCIAGKIVSSVDPDKALLMMQRDNVVNRQIESVAGYTLNSTLMVTSAVRSDFKASTGNCTVPSIIWDFNSSSPVLKTSFDASPTSYYRTMGTYSGYDGRNNVIEKYKDKDFVSSYIWDYYGVYPVAEVTNANASDIAYTSFEADGKGNWSIPPNTPYTADSRTGKQSYILSSGSIIKNGLVTNRKYIISLWAKTGASITVNLGSALTPASSTSINGWQYFETSVTGSSTVTSAIISGTATIDELRLFPDGAQMTTYTYKPGVGVTSSTDANNIVKYFEYDALGRNVTVKDDLGRILKAYKYNYKQ